MAAHRAAPPTLNELVRRFGRRFWFGSARMRDHTSLTAMRFDPSEPGVTCVITDDLGELAEALAEEPPDVPP